MDLPETIGPFAIQSSLGRGSMGHVYRAKHQATGVVVALKTVTLTESGVVASIRREIQALSRLRHPGIVRILDQGTEKGAPWYAMEVLSGQTLRALVPPLSWSEAELRRTLTLFRRLCSPLAYMHGEGIVHRDLKPDNVLVRPDGSPVLADFGLMARFGGEREWLQVDSGASGTAPYMAPELGRSDSIDARADLYALGCMLYEVLTGRPPFLADSALQILWMHAHASVDPPSHHASGIPSELDALLVRLLAKEPKHRLGYADDVARALERIGAETVAHDEAPRARCYLYRPDLAGRSHCLDHFDEALDGLREGRGGVILIGGESGIGKTRLCAELARRAAERRTWVLTSACEEARSGPLQSFCPVLRAIADRCRERGAEEADRLLGARGKLLARYEPSLAELPGQAAYADPAELSDDAGRIRLRNAVIETLATIARSASLLLVIDDAQWADAVTLDVLTHLGRSSATESRPLLLVAAYRSEEVTGPLRELLALDRSHRIDLDRLDASAVESIVRDMLAMDDPPVSMTGFLARASDGNPFFVAEYLRLAVADGLLHRDESGRWRFGAGTAGEPGDGALPLPLSVPELLRRRIDTLEPLARPALDAAAVLGRAMSDALLAAVAGIDAIAIHDAVHCLVSRQVLVPLGAELQFAHAKYREVAYASLPKERQLELHRSAARTLEALPQKEIDSSVLAHHFELCGEAAKARAYYLVAARRAVSAHGHEEAARLYRAYLSLVEGPTQESTAARNELGSRVLQLRGLMAEALEEHRAALQEAQVGGDRAGAAQSLRFLGQTHARMGQLEQAHDLGQHALSLAAELGDATLQAHIQNDLGNVLDHQGKTAEAQARYEQALDLHRRAGNRAAEGIAASNLALVLEKQGLVEEAERTLSLALARHREAGDRPSEGRTLGNIANACHRKGETARAADLYQQAIAIDRETGDLRLEAIALSNLGVIESNRGRIEEAGRAWGRALDLSRQVCDRRLEGIVLSNISLIEGHRGSLDREEDLLVQALAIHRETGDPESESYVLGSLGLLAVRRQDWERALLHLEQALAIARRLGHREHEGEIIGNLTMLRVEMGQFEEARRLGDEAIAIHRKVGTVASEGSVLMTLATLERLAGDLPRAQALAQQSEAALARAEAPMTAGTLACEKGHQALCRGEAGTEHLEEARAILQRVIASPASGLGRSIAKLERAIRAREAGLPLLRGECSEDLPPAARLRIEHGS